MSNPNVTPTPIPGVDYLKLYPILRYFEYGHLPQNLAGVSSAFHGLAYDLVFRLPNCAETSTALRKLLEAKDCAVRAAL